MSVGTSVLTNAGLQKLLAALAQGTKVKPKYYKVTDQDVNLSPTVTSIPSPWRTADIDGYVQVDDKTVEFLIVVPTEEAVKYGRTFGLYLDDGTLFLVAKPPYPFPPGMRQTFKVQFYFEQANQVLDFQYIPFDETEQSLSGYDSVATIAELVSQLQDEIALLHQARLDYYKFKVQQGSKIGKYAEWADKAVDAYRAGNADDADKVGGYTPAELVKKTIKSLTIYVDADNGDDVNGKGTFYEPYRTIDKALSVVGDVLEANVTIICKKAANSYGMLRLYGLSRRKDVGLTIRGEFNVLASGKVGSFSNTTTDPEYGSLGVTCASVTDTTKNWTINQYKNKLVRIYKGATEYVRPIIYNDATTIYFADTSVAGIDNTWNYEIVDWGTKFNVFYGFNLYGNIQLKNISLNTSSTVFQFGHCDQVNFTNCYIKSTSPSYFGILHRNTSLYFQSCVFDYAEISNNGIVAGSSAGIYISLSSCNFINLRTVAFGNNIIGKYNLNMLYCRFYRGTNYNPSYVISSLGIVRSGLTCVIDAGSVAGIQILDTGQIIGSDCIKTGPNCAKLIDFSYVGNDRTNAVFISPRIQTTAFETGITTVTANTTLSTSHFTVLVDASGGSRTITLPPAANCKGRIYVIKKIDSSANAVVIDANASETIDGQLTVSLTTQYQTIRIQSNGTAWYII